MKYKDGDTWKEITIKALDSMPVGTQVEYTGSTIPVGWEQVNDYSTTEIDTGKKWIDGKTIYRKVFTGTSITQLDSGITSLDTLVKFEVLVKDNTTNGGWRNVPWLYNTTTDSAWYGGVYFKTDDKTIRFQMGSALSGITKYVIIMEYTK